MNYKEAKKYITTPLPQEIEIPEWGGSIVVKGLNFRNIELIDDIEMFEKSIIKPNLTYDFVKQKSYKVFLKLKEIIGFKNGIHQKSFGYMSYHLKESGYLFNSFFLADKLKKNVWSDSDFIFDFYGLEVIYWRIYHTMTSKK